MVGPVNREEHDIKAKESALKAFTRHQISRSSEGRWLLQRPDPKGGWEWNMAAEIIGLVNSALYVGGDVQTMVFAYGPDSPEGLVRWIGGTSDVGYYVRQKASIGMGISGVQGVGIIDDYLPDLALTDIEDMEADYVEDLVENKGDPNAVEALDFVQRFVRGLALVPPPGTCERFRSQVEGSLDGEHRDALLRLVVNLPDANIGRRLGEWRGMQLRKLGTELAGDDPVVEGIRQAKDLVHDGHHALIEHLIEVMSEADMMDFMEARYESGLVTSSRIYYTWAAVVRLKELLDKEEESGDGDSAATG